MIELQHLSYAYGKHQVLKDISFTAQPGDCVGILGNNGAGKSTLITCLNKIRKPNSGSVLVDGANVFQMSRQETARTIAYVAQKNEMSQTTVYDAVLLGRKPYMKWGLVKEDYDLCDEMLERIGMADFKLHYINELSGGEAQKVMLARALAQQPKLLLLDEPTSSLDIHNQYQVLKIVRDICHNDGLTAIVVIHDLNLALRFCDRFLLLRRGEVYAQGDYSVLSPETLKNVYQVDGKILDVEGHKMVLVEE